MSNPKMSMNSFVKIVKEDCMWKYHSIVFIGRDKCVEVVNRTVDEYYENLWDYCKVLKITNPNSIVQIEGEGPTFKRLYI